MAAARVRQRYTNNYKIHWIYIDDGKPMTFDCPESIVEVVFTVGFDRFDQFSSKHVERGYDLEVNGEIFAEMNCLHTLKTGPYVLLRDFEKVLALPELTEFSGRIYSEWFVYLHCAVETLELILQGGGCYDLTAAPSDAVIKSSNKGWVKYIATRCDAKTASAIVVHVPNFDGIGLAKAQCQILIGAAEEIVPINPTAAPEVFATLAEFEAKYGDLHEYLATLVC